MIERKSSDFYTQALRELRLEESELEQKLRRSAKRLDAYIELKKGIPISVFFDFVRTHDIEHSNLHMDADGAYTAGAIAFSVTLKSKGEYDRQDMLKELASLGETAYVEAL